VAAGIAWLNDRRQARKAAKLLDNEVSS